MPSLLYPEPWAQVIRTLRGLHYYKCGLWDLWGGWWQPHLRLRRQPCCARTTAFWYQVLCSCLLTELPECLLPVSTSEFLKGPLKTDRKLRMNSFAISEFLFLNWDTWLWRVCSDCGLSQAWPPGWQCQQNLTVVVSSYQPLLCGQHTPFQETH